MKKQKNYGMNILQSILGGLLVVSILYFVFGEILLPRENTYADGVCTTYNEDWVKVSPDGTKAPATVPGDNDVESGDTLVIEKTLPPDQKDMSICIRSSQQDIRVYVDGQLRTNYTTQGVRWFGKNSVSVYAFSQLRSKDAGKTLRMEIESNSPYSGYVSDIYVGDKLEIWKYLFYRYVQGTMLALFMLLLSIAVICYSKIIQRIYKKKIDIFHLGVGLLIASLWLIAESKLRQLLLPNATVASDVGFFMIMLLPYPFLSYINNIQKRRYQKAYMVVAVCTIINTMVSTFLQLADIKDFSETMISSHIIIVVLILLLLLTVLMDLRKGYVKEYREVALGLAGLMLCGIYEIYLVYDKTSLYNGIALSIGLIFLLFTASVKAGRDMLKMEKEKQMAIVASESKAKFLANMSHEIRTPINTVIGMNEMILRETKEDVTREYANYIQNASRMLLGLINDVLDLSKLEAGKLELSENIYYLPFLIKDVVLGVRTRVQEKNLELHLEIDDNMPSVLRGDEIRIKQILNNLLSNAVKYTKQGSITIDMNGIWEENQFFLCFLVADTGVGIREEDMEELFDSFRRMDLGKNRNIEGTGLGLSITKNIVDEMNGTIQVTSEYGKGSCFAVRIPQIVEDRAPIKDAKNNMYSKVTKKETPESDLYAPKASVLVVDDNEMNLAVVKALLKQTGMQLDFAGGGKECLSKCKDKKYDLILMDHMMPEPDGIETLHLLRSDAKSLNQNTEVIALTANVIQDASQMYIKEGFADYLSKPIDYRRLEKLLIKYLESKISSEERLIDRRVGLSNCGDSEELYHEILKMYVGEGGKTLEDLQKYYEKKDWKEYAVFVHEMRTNALTIGAMDFSNKAKRQQAAANDEDEALIVTEWESFVKAYKEVLSYIRNQIEK